VVCPPLPPSRTPSSAALRKWRNGPVAGGPEHACAAVDAWYESLNTHRIALGHLGAASRSKTCDVISAWRPLSAVSHTEA